MQEPLSFFLLTGEQPYFFFLVNNSDNRIIYAYNLIALKDISETFTTFFEKSGKDCLPGKCW